MTIFSSSAPKNLSLKEISTLNRRLDNKMRIIAKSKQILAFMVFILILSFTVNSLVAKQQFTTENILDGIITPGEYSNSQNIDEGKFILYWKATSQNSIIFAMEVKTTGWIAIGIDPIYRMKDADMYFGWVSTNGSVHMIDAFSTDDYGPHPPDTELGGTNNIIAFDGTESDQTTIVEFERGIVTNDTKYDNPIPLTGEIIILWAYGTSDDFEAQHAIINRGTIHWSLKGASILRYDFSQPFILGLAFFITLSGLLIYVDSLGRPSKKENGNKNGEQ